MFGRITRVVVSNNGLQKEHKLISQGRDNKYLLMSLSGVADRTTAESLIGSLVLAPRSETQELESDQWWTRDLIGLCVYTTDGKLIGTICDVIVGANNLLEITPADPKKADTILIPFVSELVPIVDINAGKVIVKEIPGLIT
jgi:16S rRNA processing protein RimM